VPKAKKPLSYPKRVKKISNPITPTLALPEAVKKLGWRWGDGCEIEKIGPKLQK
jgi:hypothetical protein